MESYFDNKAVVFLDMNDFHPNGQFKYDLKGKPMLIMVGGSFCGHCTRSAPAFNKFALDLKAEAIQRPNKKARAVAAVIPVDGTQSQKDLGRFLGGLHKISGIPVFMLFIAHGEFVRMVPERKAEAFHEAVRSL